MTLDQLPINLPAAVLDIHPVNTVEAQRLISMGFTVRSKITVIRKIHRGHMIHCRVGSVEFAIRSATARLITVKIDE